MENTNRSHIHGHAYTTDNCCYSTAMDTAVLNKILNWYRYILGEKDHETRDQIGVALLGGSSLVLH